MFPQPPRFTRTDTLFPSTTRFRSHRTGTVAAIVESNVDAGSGQFVVQFFSRLLHRRRLVAADRTDDDAKRCDRVRPDDAVGIKGLFNHRRRQTRHADAVATHLRRHGLAVGVEHGDLHRLRVLGAELEDVTAFDAAVELDRSEENTSELQSIMRISY